MQVEWKNGILEEWVFDNNIPSFHHSIIVAGVQQELRRAPWI
jgi:hypothetical protein